MCFFNSEVPFFCLGLHHKKMLNRGHQLHRQSAGAAAPVSGMLGPVMMMMPLIMMATATTSAKKDKKKNRTSQVTFAWLLLLLQGQVLPALWVWIPWLLLLLQSLVLQLQILQQKWFTQKMQRLRTSSNKLQGLSLKIFHTLQKMLEGAFSPDHYFISGFFSSWNGIRNVIVDDLIKWNEMAVFMNKTIFKVEW